MKKVVFLTLLCFPFLLRAQYKEVKGVVVDEKTGEFLAFVAVSVSGSQKGTTTDIDGKFSISDDQPIHELNLNYLGYAPRRFIVDKPEVKISMKKVTVDLKEVTIVAGENPAHRIIRKAIENREANNPENLGSFSYESYNKFIYALDNFKSKKKGKEADTARVRKLMEKQNLFMMESITERKFKRPGQTKEVVLATKVSGFQDPSFAIMAGEFQSFSFYPDILKINEKNYINPISKGTFDRYFFLLTDTVFKGRDTVFVISFNPRKNKNFDALKGVLYINTHGYALENVIAEPVDNDIPMGSNDTRISIRIQQKYELAQNTQWFPSQLNADLSIRSQVDTSQALTIAGISRSYIKNIRINPELKGFKFDHIAVEYSDSAGKMPEEFWAKYRTDTLTRKEKTTYKVIDSIGKKYHFDRIAHLVEYLSSGQIPVKMFSIDLDKLVAFNYYEGFRLGMGVHTNKRLSRWFSLGGYVGYGFTDKAWKHGYDLSFNLNERRETKVKFLYQRDVFESGGYNFFYNKKAFISNENVRDYFIRVMDKVETKEVSFTHRPSRFLNMKVAIRDMRIIAGDDYLFDDGIRQTNLFNVREGELALRFAFREYNVRTFGVLNPLPTKWPVFWITYFRGFDNAEKGQFVYNKWIAKAEKEFFVKGLGGTSLALEAGMVDKALPYYLNFAGKAVKIYDDIGVRSYKTFQTMNMNEFVSDRFIYFFMSHNFGKLLYKGKKFQPQLEWANNIGYGSIGRTDIHLNREFRSMDKGLFETGISINNMYRYSFYGYGIGFFYRYGYYANVNEWKNMSILLTYVLSI